MPLALDAARKRPKGFEFSRRAEESYSRSLRKIARHIGDIVRGLAPDGVVTPESDAQMSRALRAYSEALDPWAHAVGARMIEDVSKRDLRAWTDHSERIGRALKQGIENAPTGQAMREQLAAQVGLIKSLPLDMAQRVHDLSIQGLVGGRRASEVAAEIMRSGTVSASRATLIARTESARVSSILTQVRAESIGITHFEWKTARDGSVRPSHKKMQGKICEFAKPPIVDGEPLLPGHTFNCRCWIAPLTGD